MSYTRTAWTDHSVERPRTYMVTENPDGSITLTPAYGETINQGTPVNADNLNKIENGIYTLDKSLTAYKTANDAAVAAVNTKAETNKTSIGTHTTQIGNHETRLAKVEGNITSPVNHVTDSLVNRPTVNNTPYKASVHTFLKSCFVSIWFKASFERNATGRRICEFYLNNVQTERVIANAVNGDATEFFVVWSGFVNKDDVLDVGVWQNSGGNLGCTIEWTVDYLMYNGI